jgi:nucleoid DNA-binding protein
MGKSMRQVGFLKHWRNRIEKERPALASLSDEDLLYLVDSKYEELSDLLKNGYRVTFEGHWSYYTKPIKRKCMNMNTGEEWWTFKRRLRTKPMEKMKGNTEIDITEEEYALENRKNEKIPVSL